MKDVLISCEKCEYCHLKENENSIPSNNYVCIKSDIDLKDIEQEYCSDFEPAN